jgi:serine/threonine protein kinase/Tol biopolymer transport system component
MIGTRIAHYEINTHLGSGGMGEVYEATDSKLGRRVAIKVLPEEFARDADRVARFEREARVLASLNHPHIAAIHGFEELGGRNFLVMELVEGETLAGRIARGRLPVDDALPIALQIAEALEAAHEKGIIHRDLKPANVKVTSEGQVKLLDFGLAKAFEAQPAEIDVSNSPTLSAMATHAGVILGTAAYMSPEQAKGAAVDRRTDIFAFGSVLFEMLTGRRAFEGENVADILAAVLKVEPDWSRLPADVPPSVRRLLRRCLNKDRRRRPQAAGDVRIEIEEADAAPDVSGAGHAAPQSGRRERAAWIIAILAASAAVVLAMLAFRPPPEAPEMRVEVTTPPTPDPISFAVSPDGRRLAFVASGDGAPRLWLRALDTAALQPLAGTEGASYPFWSPDSRSIGFFAGGKLKRIEAAGGPPRTLADAPEGRGGTWSVDDVILFSPQPGSRLQRVSASAGDVATVDTGVLETPRFPQFLPDGRRFLFFVIGGFGRATLKGVYLGSLDAAEPRHVTDADAYGLYMPPGWLLYIRGSALMARPFDAARGEFEGDPLVVADPVGVDANVYAAAVSVSTPGLVAYRSGGPSRRQLAWFDRSGRPSGTVGQPDENDLLGPELSPDGRRVAVLRSIRNARNVWLVDVDRGVPTPFTDDPSSAQNPQWSPDAGRIAFQSVLGDRPGLYAWPLAAASSKELLVPGAAGPQDWSHDGRFLVYTTNDPKTRGDLWTVPLAGDRTPVPFANSSYDESSGQFSPDGRWIAYRSDESGRYEIYVQPFPGPGERRRVSSDGGTEPRWRADGREIFYISPDAKMIAVPFRSSGPAPGIGTPVTLFQTRKVRGGTGNVQQQYDVSPDGRFLINVNADENVASPIMLIMNWKTPIAD